MPTTGRNGGGGVFTTGLNGGVCVCVGGVLTMGRNGGVGGDVLATGGNGGGGGGGTAVPRCLFS